MVATLEAAERAWLTHVPLGARELALEVFSFGEAL